MRCVGRGQQGNQGEALLRRVSVLRSCNNEEKAPVFLGGMAEGRKGEMKEPFGLIQSHRQ